jgi:ATP-dependent helicase HrpB
VSPNPLPIDSLLPEVVASLVSSQSLVIEAPPGAGKTTRVPPALLSQAEGEIIVLQPRRLPARMAAARVAEELGEPLGQTVGYTVRFEDVGGPRTRLRFMTEGILLRRLLVDPLLRGISVVVLDEFHERHLATDLSLALLARLQGRERPDLRIVVMSATLESEPVRQFLGQCPAVRSEGRAYPVSVDYLDAPDHRRLADGIASSVRRLHRDGCAGDVLVFLPGAGEIRRAGDALAGWASEKNILLVPLHGELSPAEQRRAVSRAARPKVILSTNVAETSVTIDGVVAVIDSGLARIASHSPWSGLPRLAVGKISQASAIQRAGRAGRTCPGQAIRLYTRHDFDSRRQYEVPEIGRLDLSEAVLTLAALGVTDPSRFDWFEAPGAASLEAATTLLGKLDAISADGKLTPTGREMLRFPAHPRLARLLVEGERRGVGEQSAALAGILSEGDISDSARALFGDAQPRGLSAEGADLLERLDRFGQARSCGFDKGRMRALGVDAHAAGAAERARRQYAGALRRALQPRPSTPEAVDAVLAMATLTAFPDRVMRRRTPGASQAVLSAGGSAEVAPLPAADLLVAVDAEERAGAAGRQSGALVVRLAVGIEPDWLLDLVPGGLSETEEIVWSSERQRVEAVGRLRYGAVVLDETRRPANPSPEASRLLAEAALASGVADGTNSGSSLPALQVKLDILRDAFPELKVPQLDTTHLQDLLATACEGITSMAELSATSMEDRLRSGLPGPVMRSLMSDTPDRISVGHRQVTVSYEAGKPPWIAARLQDFFGMRSGPTICRGRVPLTLHLLAPNQRAVQVTSDLGSFWQKHYPAIRKELSRRYPKHAWPEDGANATPPAPRPRRG